MAKIHFDQHGRGEMWTVPHRRLSMIERYNSDHVRSVQRSSARAARRDATRRENRRSTEGSH